jgi:hypothetical protein
LTARRIKSEVMRALDGALLASEIFRLLSNALPERRSRRRQ